MAYCNKCGGLLDEKHKFCSNCGTESSHQEKVHLKEKNDGSVGTVIAVILVFGLLIGGE